MKKYEEKFIKECKRQKYTNEEIELFQKAINFSKKYLEQEKRKNLSNSFEHSIRIGNYLIKGRLSKEIICAGLLYKTETKITKKELIENFGEEITQIVLGQEKIREIRKKSSQVDPKIIRQILLSQIDDVRVIIIKLAAKLDNIKHTKHLNEKDKKILATEVIDLYVPLVTSLGIESIRKDLLDSAFKLINSKKYKEIATFLKDSKSQREKVIKSIIKKVNDLTKKENIETIEIKGREKQIFSINEKIVKRNIPLDKQKDHFAIRIITTNVENCYRILGILNQKYKMIPETLKDYIKSPKINRYQSLHVVIEIEKQRIVEVQIRTKKMDEEAEEGNASHWSYKKSNTSEKLEKRSAWIKEIFKVKEQEENKQFLGNLKLNLFGDKIYCYTPKGDVFKLPKNSTVLDFAYRIHAEIGNKATGARINGKFTPIKTILKDSDTVEIITNKFQTPRRDWMKFVITSYAKKIIAREVKRRENIPVSKKTLLEKEEEKNIETPIEITDFPNHLIDFAKCCNPIPGDKTIGIIRSHRRILVHKKDCIRITEAKKAQVDSFWKNSYTKPVKLIVEAKDRSGILADILNTITRQGFKIVEANAKLIGNNYTECSFQIMMRTLTEFIDIIERVKRVRGTTKIWIE